MRKHRLPFFVRFSLNSSANRFNTVDVFKKLVAEFPLTPIKVVWDTVSYHRARLVQQAAQILDIGIVPLAAYSPDFMPVEHLGQWLREDITYHACYDTKADLIAQVQRFQLRINAIQMRLLIVYGLLLISTLRWKNYGSQPRRGLAAKISLSNHSFHLNF